MNGPTVRRCEVCPPIAGVCRDQATHVLFAGPDEQLAEVASCTDCVGVGVGDLIAKYGSPVQVWSMS